jgi:tRNA (guanine37-N1)-methyltransferase
MFDALKVGITGRALKEKQLEIHCWNPRDYATDKHKSVDDRPYGGGPGMVMMTAPLQAAITAAKAAAPETPTVIYLSPQGRRFDQAAAEIMATKRAIILIAGRYEGIDERIIQQEVDEEWSVGDYIVSGGELPAMIMIDAITRLIPGTIGDAESVTQDSLTSGLLKYPQYTRPEELGGHKVPEVLLSGHHKQIEEWRLKISLGKTWQRRPDLLANRSLSPQETQLLNEYIKEFKK